MLLYGKECGHKLAGEHSATGCLNQGSLSNEMFVVRYGYMDAYSSPHLFHMPADYLKSFRQEMAIACQLADGRQGKWADLDNKETYVIWGRNVDHYAPSGSSNTEAVYFRFHDGFAYIGYADTLRVKVGNQYVWAFPDAAEVELAKMGMRFDPRPFPL